MPPCLKWFYCLYMLHAAHGECALKALETATCKLNDACSGVTCSVRFNVKQDIDLGITTVTIAHDFGTCSVGFNINTCVLPLVLTASVGCPSVAMINVDVPMGTTDQCGRQATEPQSLDQYFNIFSIPISLAVAEVELSLMGHVVMARNATTRTLAGSLTVQACAQIKSTFGNTGRCWDIPGASLPFAYPTRCGEVSLTAAAVEQKTGLAAIANSIATFVLVPIFCIACTALLLWKRSIITSRFNGGCFSARPQWWDAAHLFFGLAASVCSIYATTSTNWGTLEDFAVMGIFRFCLIYGDTCMTIGHLNVSTAASDKIFAIQVLLVCSVVLGLYGLAAGLFRVVRPAGFKCALTCDCGAKQLTKLTSPRPLPMYRFAFWLHLLQAFCTLFGLSLWSAVMNDHLTSEFGRPVSMGNAFYVCLATMFLSIGCAVIALTARTKSPGGQMNVSSHTQKPIP